MDVGQLLETFLGIWCLYSLRQEYFSVRLESCVQWLLCGGCTLGILVGFDCPLLSNQPSTIDIFTFIIITMLIRRYYICSISLNEAYPLYIFTAAGFSLSSSVLYALDWEKDWQRWPIPTYYGLIGGIVLADVIEFAKNIRTTERNIY